MPRFDPDKWVEASPWYDIPYLQPIVPRLPQSKSDDWRSAFSSEKKEKEINFDYHALSHFI